MSIPALRPPPPALPVAAAVAAMAHAGLTIALNVIRMDPWPLYNPAYQRYWPLITMGARAVTIGAMIVGAAAALSLVRARRSAGAALTAAAFLTAAVALCAELVATWIWPWYEAGRGWRADVLHVTDWVIAAPPLLAAIGLCAAGWADRAVRVIAPGAIGAGLVLASPPPLTSWAYSWIEHGTWRWSVEAGSYVQVPDARMWIVPGMIAAASLAWGVGVVLLVQRLPPVPVDTVAPRPPAPALRRLAVALLAMAAIAVVAGIAIALLQGKPAHGARPFELAIPIAVAVACTAVAAALVNVAVTDVVPRAVRGAAIAAIAVLWCVAVVAAQTLASQRPDPDLSGGLNPLLEFAIFDPPWMPGMVGAAVAVVALLAMASTLTAIARQAGQRPSRVQTVIIVLALVIGALTTPWVLGFGTRRLEMDTLRVATLASAAIVNLAAWIALARSAWRTAAALDAPVIASAPQEIT